MMCIHGIFYHILVSFWKIVDQPVSPSVSLAINLPSPFSYLTKNIDILISNGGLLCDVS